MLKLTWYGLNELAILLILEIVRKEPIVLFLFVLFSRYLFIKCLLCERCLRAYIDKLEQRTYTLGSGR